MDKKKKLLNAVEKFIKEQDIHCSEDIYQRDKVIENAYEFIDELCEIVGYLEDEE